MFTLKTQGVFERFQCGHILSLLSAFCRNLVRMYEENGCAFIPAWAPGCEGHRGGGGIDKGKAVC